MPSRVRNWARAAGQIVVAGEQGLVEEQVERVEPSLGAFGVADRDRLVECDDRGRPCEARGCRNGLRHRIVGGRLILWRDHVRAAAATMGSGRCRRGHPELPVGRSCRPGGGRCRQPGGGIQPAGGTGHPGGGLNRQPDPAPAEVANPLISWTRTLASAGCTSPKRTSRRSWRVTTKVAEWVNDERISAAATSALPTWTFTPERARSVDENASTRSLVTTTWLSSGRKLAVTASARTDSPGLR